MKQLWTFLFIFIGLQALALPMADAQSPGISYVYTETASLWNEPGYSWKVCDQLSHKDASNDSSAFFKTVENCNINRKYMQGGDEVMVLLDKNKKLDSVEKNVTINGQTQKIKFYHVEVTVIDENGHPVRKQGWMSADQITEPEQDHTADEVVIPEKKPTCPPRRKNPVKEAQKNIKDIQDHLANQIALGSLKSDQEIDHFVCLYRKSNISDAQLNQMLPQFQQAAKKAEVAFKIPYGITMCTMLIESGLNFNAKENKEYRGLGQFGSAIVDDLSKLSNNTKSPYSKMWDNYTNEPLTDRGVRTSNNPEVATGAVAMMLRWIYQDRLPASKCKDCSSNEQFNRRDLYLMVAGYNYSPYAIQKIANRSLAQMHQSFPPPRETRNYMTQMDRCLEKGQEKKFRVGRDDKHEEISHEYKDRKKTCDSQHPS